jgi:hypothetical protein
MVALRGQFQDVAISVTLGCARNMRIRQVKLFATIETDLIRPAFDREHTAQVTVTTAEHELEHPTQRVHRSRLLLVASSRQPDQK